MENHDIIENLGASPAEEQARLAARQKANEWAAIERMRRENAILEEKLTRLQALVAEQKAVVMQWKGSPNNRGTAAPKMNR